MASQRAQGGTQHSRYAHSPRRNASGHGRHTKATVHLALSQSLSICGIFCAIGICWLLAGNLWSCPRRVGYAAASARRRSGCVTTTLRTLLHGLKLFQTWHKIALVSLTQPFAQTKPTSSPRNSAELPERQYRCAHLRRLKVCSSPNKNPTLPTQQYLQRSPPSPPLLCRRFSHLQVHRWARLLQRSTQGCIKRRPWTLNAQQVSGVLF